MVALNVLIDPRAVDVTLVPRLLALLVFLVFVCGLLLLSPATVFPGAAGWWRDPVVLLFGSYALLTSGSLVFASNVTAGLTDVFRTWGAFAVLVSACVLLATIPDWPRLVTRMGIVAGMVSGAAGAYELMNALGFGVHDRNELLAVTGLMSNINLYASLLLLVLPLCFGGAVIMGGIWRAAAIGTASIVLLLVFLLQTRAAYLGAAGGLVVLSVTVFFARQALGVDRCVSRNLPALIALMLLLVTTFVVVADGNQIAERVRSIFSPEFVTAAGGRLVIWSLTWQMAMDHWLTGIGAGSFPVLLHNYFDIDNPEFSPIHPNWLQPHNDFLWVLAEKGVFGLLLYLGIFAAAFGHLLATLRSDLPSDRKWVAVFVAMGLTGYLVVSFFDFPMERINHQVYLVLYLAMAVVLGCEARGITAVPSNPPNLRLLRWGGAVVTSVLILGIVYATSALRQERFVLLAREAFVEEDWKSTVYYAQRAATPWKTLDPFATPVSYLEGWAHLMLADMPSALACLERARSEMPSRAYIINSLGLVHGMVGNHEKAIACYNEVLRRSPGNPSAMNDLARGYLGAGNPRRALEILQEIPPEQRSDAIKSNLGRAQRLLQSGQ